jgi:molecular chaperone GrpE (heat shock protein)
MLGDILFWLTKRRQVEELAKRAEATARDLNKLPADPTTPQQSLLDVLQTTCALLDRLAEQQKATLLVKEHAEKLKPTAPEQPQATSAPLSVASASLSTTAKELIKLSDWVLLAKANATAVQPEVLEEIYRQLTAVLAREGVTPLLATGPCDYERQRVVGTQPAEDPAQVDHVYSTVRPGYIFHEQLIRPQEVIIYV